MSPRAEGMVDLVFVQIGLKRYAFPVQVVEEVLPMVEPTHIPAWPDHALGVINVRGELLPLVDVAPILGRPASAIRPSEHIVVVSAFGRRWGVIVEEVEDIRAGIVSHSQAGGPPESLDPGSICQGLTVESSGLAVVVLNPTGLLQPLRSLGSAVSGAPA